MTKMHKMQLVVDQAEEKAGLTTASLAGGSSHPSAGVPGWA